MEQGSEGDAILRFGVEALPFGFQDFGIVFGGLAGPLVSKRQAFPAAVGALLEGHGDGEPAFVIVNQEWRELSQGALDAALFYRSQAMLRSGPGGACFTTSCLQMPFFLQNRGDCLLEACRIPGLALGSGTYGWSLS